MKKLIQWMKSEKLSQPSAAKRFGITQSHLSRILAGDREPGPKLTLKIEHETGISREFLRPNLFRAAR
jgi:transcriptional regulator with XRE-family HTH domain